jgi:opacity protein-like surface antigen
MRKILLLSALLCGTSLSFAQSTDSLMDELNDDPAQKNKKEDVNFTFKATRICNTSSVENLGAGVLDLRICHRFGKLNQGAENFFGLDNATTKLALDYGVTKWLMVGIEHSTLNKENDVFAKEKLLKQQKHGMPVTVSYFGSVSAVRKSTMQIPAGTEWHFSNQLAYINQILIARKISNALSLQLTPTLVHYNLVDSSKFSNNTFALGIGGRIKVSKRVAITGEYYLRLTNQDMLVIGSAAKTYNSATIGLDIETGGHVFQLMFSNSFTNTERVIIGQTSDSWSDGGIHFGFNISRVFTVVKPKEFRN